MKFSIIIPAYNSAKHIRKALDSIAQQTYKDYELIVVCDNCWDDTQKIAESYGAVTKAVKYGCDGLTRNVGLSMAQGEWVLFMDDDDWWLHEFVLEMLANKLDQVSCDILAFSFIFKGVCYAKPLKPNGHHWIAIWNKCWKREFIKDARFPDIYSVSDRYFVQEVMHKHPKIVDWDMPMYYYNYLREDSISQQSGQSYESIKKALKEKRV